MNEFDRVIGGATLLAAWQTISGRNDLAGTDGVTLKLYAQDADHNLDRLRFSLKSGLYRPYADKRIECSRREIRISCVEDKIVQTAVAAILRENTTFPDCVHGFVKGKSVYTAYDAIEQGLCAYPEKLIVKADIKRFYESIDHELMMQKLSQVSSDARFLGLIRLLLGSGGKGLATGSALSPILSNIYLKDFDEKLAKMFPVYVRYVDDLFILLPSQMAERREDAEKTVAVIEHLLRECGFCVNREKTQILAGDMPFYYLGQPFNQTPKDHCEIEALLAGGRFSEAEARLEQNAQEEREPRAKDTHPEPQEGVPDHIAAIEKNCGILHAIVRKAAAEGYLNLQEKRAILFSFSCFGEDGRKYIHRVLSKCIDYDYRITEHEIERGAGLHPIGCRKMFTRFEGLYPDAPCSCVFPAERMYPSPVCHALAVNPTCYVQPPAEEKLGHLRVASEKTRMEELIAKYADLTRQLAEMRTQESICNEQMDLLFAKNGLTEVDTGQGKVIRTEDGYFLKLG